MKKKSERVEYERLALPLLKDLYYISLSLTNSSDLAEDLVQEAMTKAYQSFAQFDRKRSFKSWIFTILHNSHIDLCRRRKIEPAVVDMEELNLPSGGISSPMSGLENILSEEMIETIKKIPRHQQVLLILADIEGLSYKEIADATGKPMGSVMSGLYYARENMRKLLRRRISQG